jgi:hypothetical protein
MLFFWYSKVKLGENPVATVVTRAGEEMVDPDIDKLASYPSMGENLKAQGNMQHSHC